MPRIIGLIMEKLNSSVTWAATNSGTDAIRIFVNSSPDVVISDIHRVYGMNGLELTRSILEIDKSAKIILISDDPDLRQESIIAGAKAFFKTPLNYRGMLSKIKLLSTSNLLERLKNIQADDENEIISLNRRLIKLKDVEAYFGKSVDPSVLMEIEDIEEKL